MPKPNATDRRIADQLGIPPFIVTEHRLGARQVAPWVARAVDEQRQQRRKAKASRSNRDVPQPAVGT